MRSIVLVFAAIGCSNSSLHGPDLVEDDPDALSRVTCDPLMSVFPVGDAHNIGYDSASCGSGTCAISCPDANANSDWGGRHHGIDIFAYQGAPLVAVADGVVQRVGVVSATSGLRVRLRDACGWEYYYGHLDEAFVNQGQTVSAGDIIGTMGFTGAASTHLHFNVSPDGAYSNDINPFPLLAATSATACQQPPAPPSTPTPPPPSNPGPLGCGELAAGTALLENQPVASCDGRTSLVMQGDGNLVLYGPDGARWNSGTHGNPGATASFQGDGNLVVYSAWGTPLWHAGTHGNPDARLSVRDDGDLQVRDRNTVLWRSNSGGLPPAQTPPPSNPTPPPAPPTPAPAPPPAGSCGVLAPNSPLHVNVPVPSCNGNYELVMQGDGNLVLYGPSGAATWHTVTHGNVGASAVFQGDGNLVVYSAWGNPLWHAGTHGNPGAELVVSNSGAVQVRSASGNTLWSSAW